MSEVDKITGTRAVMAEVWEKTRGGSAYWTAAGFEAAATGNAGTLQGLHEEIESRGGVGDQKSYEDGFKSGLKRCRLEQDGVVRRLTELTK